jgi:broad specificity phosphatase PhoE
LQFRGVQGILRINSDALWGGGASAVFYTFEHPTPYASVSASTPSATSPLRIWTSSLKRTQETASSVADKNSSVQKFDGANATSLAAIGGDTVAPTGGAIATSVGPTGAGGVIAGGAVATSGGVIVRRPVLDELDAGVCDGMTYDEIALRLPDEFKRRTKVQNGFVSGQR